MQLPPLMSRKSETRSSRSPAHTDESSRPESAQSTHSDYQTSTTTTSQAASKSATAEQQASNTTVSLCNIIRLVYNIPTMHYFGNPRHTQSMTEYFWKFRWRLHCCNVVKTPHREYLLSSQYGCVLEFQAKITQNILSCQCPFHTTRTGSMDLGGTLWGTWFHCNCKVELTILFMSIFLQDVWTVFPQYAEMGNVRVSA